MILKKQILLELIYAYKPLVRPISLSRLPSSVMSPTSKMVKSRFCLISDTHARAPFPSTETQHGYRLPLPSADVLIHAGDLTMTGRIDEYRVTLDMLRAADAELKIVIGGNHDLTLDANYWRNDKAEVEKAKELWMGEVARGAGLVYLEEGLSKFELKNGATFKVSACQCFFFRCMYSPASLEVKYA